MKMTSKLVIAGAFSVLLAGCSGEEASQKENEVTAVSEKVSDAPSKKTKDEAKATEPAGFLDVEVKDPGKADPSAYVDPSLAQVIYGHSKISNTILPIEKWREWNIDGLGFAPEFEEYHQYAIRYNDLGAGAFEKRDAEKGWKEGWEKTLQENEAPNRLFIDVPIDYIAQKHTFSSYDFDSQSFPLDLHNGTNQGENIITWISWGKSGNYAYTIVNTPDHIKVIDEEIARKIEDLRQDSKLSIKVYGGVVGVKEVQRGSRKNPTLVADFHFGEVVNRRTDEVILTF